MEQKTYGEQAGEAVEKTRTQAAETVRTAARAGNSFVENQRRLFAAEVDGYACALHETARQLHDQSQDRVADYTESFARTLDGLAYNLREQDFDETVDRFSDFVRRQPMLFLGGTVAAGFLMTRFLKSSRGGEYEEEVSGSTGERMKEKVASGVERAKEATRETMEKAREKVAEGKEKMAESGRYEEKPARKRDDTVHDAPTAAEVEIPVILKPHEPEHPAGPAPKA